MEETKDDERIEYKIYQIVCNETDEVYIGKTTRTLELRLQEHKQLDCTSKQIIDRGDYCIEQIDSTFDEEESVRLESYYIRNTDKCVNERIPGRTPKEWREENINKVKEHDNKKYQKNKEKINEKKK